LLRRISYLSFSYVMFDDISFSSYASAQHSFQYFVSEPLVQVVIRGKGDAESHMFTRSFEFTHNSLEYGLDGSSKYYSIKCYFL
jgi:hypothetical protein